MQNILSTLLGTIMELIVYVGLGFLLLFIGAWVMDLVVPVDFSEEIEKQNKAVAWLSSGIYIGLGFIIKSSIQSIDFNPKEGGLLYGVIDTAVFAILGTIFFIIAYYLFDAIYKKYKFHEEIAKKNEAVGIMLFGLFVGLALIISGVII